MPNNVNRKIYLLVICFFISAGFSQILANEKFNLSYFYPTEQEVNLSNISTQVFSTMPNSKSFGVKNGVYWFKLQLDSKNNSNAIVYVPSHNIDYIELYYLSGNKLEYISKTGNLITQEELALDYKFPAFKIDNNELERTYFMKVHFPKGANFPLKVVSEEFFNINKTNLLIYLSFFYGISFVVLLIHLFFFFKFKNPYYLYYFGFLFTLMFNLLMFDGTLLHYFRPFKFSGYIELFFHVIEELFLLAFSIYFLGLKKRVPKFVKIAYYLPILLALAYTLFLFLGDFKIVAIADSLGICTMLILWIIGLYYWKKSPFAKFYVLGYLILMPLGLYYFIGYSFGWWSVTGEDNIVKIGSAIDMLVFTYAITFRMKVKEEKDKTEILSLVKEVETTKGKIKEQNPYFIFLKKHFLTNSPLTLKEIEILEGICKNQTNPKIAENLFISLSTVKTHVGNIFRKFEVSTRKELKEIVLKK